MSLSVRIGVSAFWIESAIFKLHQQFPNVLVKCILILGSEYSNKSPDSAGGLHPIHQKRPKKLSGLLQAQFKAHPPPTFEIWGERFTMFEGLANLTIN